MDSVNKNEIAAAVVSRIKTLLTYSPITCELVIKQMNDQYINQFMIARSLVG